MQVHPDDTVEFSSLPNDKILDWYKMKPFADDKKKRTKELKLVLKWGRKHCGKKRKCWLPAFSSFPTMFSSLLIQIR